MASLIKKLAISAALLASSTIAVSNLGSRLMPDFLRGASTQNEQLALESALQKNRLTLEEKSRILANMYNGRAKLVPINYNGQAQNLDSIFKTADGYARVGINNGDIYAQSFATQPPYLIFKGYDVNTGGFALSNRADFAVQDANLLNRPLDNSGKIADDSSASIPKGNSLLIAHELSTKGGIASLVDGLRQFTAKNPDLGINVPQIGIIEAALREFIYLRPDYVYAPTVIVEDFPPEK